MLGGAVSIIKTHSNKIQNQFISIDELLGMLSSLEEVSTQEVALWLEAHEHILRKTKRLVLINEHLLKEYEYSEKNFYYCPIQVIRLIGGGEDYSLCTREIGFARSRLLIDLKNEGFAISDKLINESYPYVSNESLACDDNFYKNQLIDLLSKQYNNNEQQVQATKSDIPFIHFLDSNNPCYVPTIALLLRVNHDLNYVERFKEEKTKVIRVMTCLEEYGNQYGYNATDTHAKTIANILPNRKDASQEAKEFIKNVLVENP